MRSPAEEAIACLVWALNLWFLATGSTTRVKPRDVTITRYRGVWFLAIPEVPTDDD